MDIITIILFIILIGVGVAAGYLIAQLRQRTSAVPPSPSEIAPDPEGAIEGIRLWRTQDSQLHLGMNRQQEISPEVLSDEQRQALVKMVVDLRPWLAIPQASVPPSVPAPSAPAPTAPVPSVQPAAAIPVQEELVRPSAAPVVEKAKASAGAKPGPVVIKSIVGQIDEVLQKKLEGSALKSQDIRLTEGVGGSVIVKIGLLKYEGIDSVPEAEIRDLIRQAVVEWENNQR